jgi:hypothetical protein
MSMAFPAWLSLPGFPCRKLDLHESVQRSGLNGVWTIAIFLASGVSLDKTNGRIANPGTRQHCRRNAACVISSCPSCLPQACGAVKTTFLICSKATLRPGEGTRRFNRRRLKRKSHAISQNLITVLCTERKPEPPLKIHKAEFVHGFGRSDPIPRTFERVERTRQPESV